MSAPKRPEYDSSEFARRWQAGETLESLADWLGVCVVAVHRAAYRRGFAARARGRKYANG